MKMDKMIIVKSMVDHKVGIKIPDINLRVIWEKKGAKKPVPEDKLQMAMYNSGVEYLFKQGMLVIEDEEAKKELYLDEVVVEPLTEKQKENLWKNAPLVDFKQRIKDIPYEQLKMLADWAVDNSYTDYEKSKVLKDLIGVDTVSKIAFKHTGDDM